MCANDKQKCSSRDKNQEISPSQHLISETRISISEENKFVSKQAETAKIKPIIRSTEINVHTKSKKANSQNKRGIDIEKDNMKIGLPDYRRYKLHYTQGIYKKNKIMLDE